MRCVLSMISFLSHTGGVKPILKAPSTSEPLVIENEVSAVQLWTVYLLLELLL